MAISAFITNRAAKNYWLLLFSALLSGCSQLGQLYIFNDSDAKISISLESLYEQKEQVISPQAAGMVYLNFDRVNEITIISGTESLCYTFPIPLKDIRTQSWKGEKMFFKFTNKKEFMLYPKDSDENNLYKGIVLNPQPKEFPLTARKCRM